MLIFMDSSVLCSNYYLNGPTFEIIQKIGTIVLGQIVVDEVCNKYEEMLKTNLQNLNKEATKINRMLEKPIKFSTDGLLESEIKKYKDFLEMFSIESGMTVAESYPDISHEKVVLRALQRKKPFKNDGSTGYRDYLVWRTCIELAHTYKNEDIHFITNNINDFSNSNDKSKLHDDLLQDLKEEGIDITKFYYWTSLKSFINEYATDCISRIEQRENLISEIEGNEKGFQNYIQKFVDNSIVGMDILGYDILVPGERSVIRNVENYSGYNIENIYNINESEYLLDICIDSIGFIESISNKSEISEYDDEFDIKIIEQYENNECLIQTITGIQIHLKAIYNISSASISSIELENIDDYYCPYCS